MAKEPVSLESLDARLAALDATIAEIEQSLALTIVEVEATTATTTKLKKQAKRASMGLEQRGKEDSNRSGAIAARVKKVRINGRVVARRVR